MKATSRSTLPVLTRVIPRKTAPRLALLLLLALLVCLAALAAGAYAQTATFTAQELLGKPTDTSVTINIVPAAEHPVPLRVRDGLRLIRPPDEPRERDRWPAERSHDPRA